jgi:hypothetical protein
MLEQEMSEGEVEERYPDALAAFLASERRNPL